MEFIYANLHLKKFFLLLIVHSIQDPKDTQVRVLLSEIVRKGEVKEYYEDEWGRYQVTEDLKKPRLYLSDCFTK